MDELQKINKDIAKEIARLQKLFNFEIELELTDNKIIHLNFADGRSYTLQHPSAIVASELLSTDHNVAIECLKYMIENCIRPRSGSETKVLNVETLDLDETLELWNPFAWRWLRRGSKLVIG